MRSPLVVTKAWFQVAILTFVIGFGVLGYLAYRTYADHPPVPRAAVALDGAVLFSGDDVFRGQLVFEKYGIMEYGTLFGHGAYLGPDFTADYIERAREVMHRFYEGRALAGPDARVIEDFKTNRWDEVHDVVVYTPAQVAAWLELQDYYRRWFGPTEINLPVVSYWEIGTHLTANHSHAAMMGVYGMLAIGFFLFVAAYFVPSDARAEQAERLSFWSLNGGLAWMVCVNLFPIGVLQLHDALLHGYWHARRPEFFARADIRMLEWLRLPGDVIFIVGGIVPLVYLAVRMVANRKGPGAIAGHESIEPLTRTL